jgi:phage terminase large subunit-like protein
MGKRGPKRAPQEVLRRRGSWRAKRRDKDAAAKRTKAAARRVPLIKAPKRPTLTDAKLRALILTLPGYDPRKGAEAYRFDCAKARHAIEWFPANLRHVKGACTGQPFVLEPWEQAIIGNLFGWVDKKSGLRRYRRCFILIAKKNGKTPLAAGIIDYILFEDGEPGAEIVGAASKYEQASLVWTHAAGMIRQNDALSKRAHVFRGQAKSIEVGSPGEMGYGTYKVISGDVLGSHGYNLHGAVVDELHAFPNGELVDSLEAGTGARRQPLIVFITTKDYDRISVCNEKEKYARDVRDGAVTDPEFLPVIFAVDDETADWKDPKVWRLANPNMGVSIYEKSLAAECREAVELPRKENTFKRLHLNMRTAQETKWLSLDSWRACIVPPGDPDGLLDPNIGLKGRPCVLGMDLSSVSDITSIGLLFLPRTADDVFRAMWKFYVPADNVDRRVRRDKVPYDLWGRQGFITLTPGNVIDYSYIRKDLGDICSTWPVQAVAFDRWNFEALRQQVISEGIPEDLFVSFGQGYASMSPATKSVERLVLGKKIVFADNPVLLWMARNVAVQTDAADNVKPSKEASGEKIDGITALIMATGVATRTSERKPSGYEGRGIRTIDLNSGALCEE